jgi:hypothetical protein
MVRYQDGIASTHTFKPYHTQTIGIITWQCQHTNGSSTKANLRVLGEIFQPLALMKQFEHPSHIGKNNQTAQNKQRKDSEQARPQSPQASKHCSIDLL